MRALFTIHHYWTHGEGMRRGHLGDRRPADGGRPNRASFENTKFQTSTTQTSPPPQQKILWSSVLNPVSVTGDAVSQGGEGLLGCVAKARNETQRFVEALCFAPDHHSIGPGIFAFTIYIYINGGLA